METPTYIQQFREMEKHTGWIPEHRERLEAFLTTLNDEAEARGREYGLRQATDIINGWDISKGGYLNLAHAVLESARNPRKS